jgi:hypothetical protein
VGKVVVRFNAVGASGYHKTVEGGAGLSPIHGIVKQPSSRDVRPSLDFYSLDMWNRLFD